MFNDRLNYEMVPIENVKMNPLNPRKDYAVDSHKIQKIIEENGWETAITCYKKKDQYIIMSGHRRYYAATQMKLEHVPVYITSPPENEAEELERLLSAQGNKEDWNNYEWSRYTFDLWNYRGGEKGTSVRELALKLGVSETVVSNRLLVFRYFEHKMIEKKLLEGSVNITVLSQIAIWIEKLKKKFPDLVEDLSINLIKTSMISKAEKKKVASHELRTDVLLDVGEESVIRKFLKEFGMSLKEAYELATGEEYEATRSNGSKFGQAVLKLEKGNSKILQIGADDKKDAKRLVEEIEELELKLQNKINELQEYAKAE